MRVALPIKGVFKRGGYNSIRLANRGLPRESQSRPYAMPALFPFFAGLALTSAATDDARARPPASAPTEIDQAVRVWRELSSEFRRPEQAQVRIEQHIILRIAPMPGPSRQNLTALAPSTLQAPRTIERKMGDCVQMSWIVGGQPQGESRLLLFLRDRRMVAANLEKACSARDFYRGFYVDKPNGDGRLCADRDRILARSGARCRISSFRLLVTDD